MLKKIVALTALSWSVWAWAAVDVNQADQAQLVQIKGIGPATAGSILQAREQGPFTSWADLIVRVKGIGQATAGKLSANGLTVNDQPYGEGATAAATTTTTATTIDAAPAAVPAKPETAKAK